MVDRASRATVVRLTPGSFLFLGTGMIACSVLALGFDRLVSDAPKQGLVFQESVYVLENAAPGEARIVEFKVDNSSKMPVRIIGAGEVCGQGICCKEMDESEFASTLDPGESRILRIRARVSTPEHFAIEFPVYFEEEGRLRQIHLVIRGGTRK